MVHSASAGSYPPADLALVEAWLMVGEPERALGTARLALAAPDAGWEAHLAYLEAANAAGHGWATVAEYRWLAARVPGLEPIEAWAEVLAARGPEVEPAMARLEVLAAGGGEAEEHLMGRALLRLGRSDEALAHLEGAHTPADRRAQIEALVATGQAAAAAAAVLDSLKALPAHPEVAVALFEPGVEPDRAVRRARRAAVRAAGDVQEGLGAGAMFHAWLLLAWAREKEETARAAEVLARREPGLGLPPRLPYGPAMVRSLGEGLAQTDQQAARAPLTSAETEAVAVVRARTLRDGGRPELALAAYRGVVELDPGDPALLLEAAETALALDPAQAATWARQAATAVGTAPGLPIGAQRSLLARSLEVQAGLASEAGVALALRLEASLLEPGPEALLALARAQEAAGATEPALESLARAAAFGSDTAAARLEEIYLGPAAPEALVAAARAGLDRPSPWERPHPPGPPAARHLDLPLATTAGDLSLSTWNGQVVVLVFWASWCKPCAQELPQLAAQGAAWAAEGLPVRILAVSVDDDEAGWARGRERFTGLGIDLAWSRDLAAALGVRAVPATRVLDQDGQPAGRLQGFDPAQTERLDRLVRGLLEP
ncbi:MAG: redoxin domain-containing protein [Pseudomonadota bacterium]